MLLVEHKSLGQDLGKAESQASQLHSGSRRATADRTKSRALSSSPISPGSVCSTWSRKTRKQATFRGGYRIEFPLDDLHHHIHDFAFIPGYQQHRFRGPGPD